MAETENRRVHPAIALMDNRREEILNAVPKSFRASLEWDRIRGSVATAIAKSESLAKCNPGSILMSVLEIVGKGLDIGMDGQAYLVPFKGACTPMIGAQGKIELAYRSKAITKIVVQVLYENDEFMLDLANGEVEHRMGKDYLLQLARGELERGQMLACYARIWLASNSDPILEVMTVGDFNKIAAEAERRSGGRLSPAYTNWPGEMFRRSCLNRALKRAPKSRDLMEVLNREMELEAEDPAERPSAMPDNVPARTALPDYGEPEEDIDAKLDALKAKEAALVAQRGDVIESEDPAPQTQQAARQPETDTTAYATVRQQVVDLEKQVGAATVGTVRKKIGGIGPGPLRSDLSLEKLTVYGAELKAAVAT